MNERVILSIRQFASAWRLMCAGGPNATDVAGEGIEYIFSGLPIAFFNVAILTRGDISSDALRAYGREACAFAQTQNVPWLFVSTTEGLAPGTDGAAVLDECGLGVMMPMTGMIAERVSPALRTPDDLHLTVPQDDSGCAAVLDVNALAYGMDLEAGKALLGRASFWQPHFPVVGFAGGKPACSAAVMMVDDHRYVALVATDPGQQRRGFGDAAMRRALELSARAHGERPTVLHATEAGRPVYERMGYAPISTHTIFMEKKYLHA